MLLNDFLSKLPIDKITKTEILSNKIQVPVNISASKFYNNFSGQINSLGLTEEKALFVCAKLKREKFIGYQDMLNSKIKY